jgi:hypothetical protein
MLGVECGKQESFINFFLAVGQGFLIHEVSRSHTQRRTTVGTTPLDKWLARRRDLYLTTLTRQTDIHAAGKIRKSNPIKRGAADVRLRPRSHCDRQWLTADENKL